MKGTARFALLSVQTLTYGLLLSQSLRTHLVALFVSERLASGPVAALAADIACVVTGFFLLALAALALLARNTLVSLLNVLFQLALVGFDFAIAEEIGAAWALALVLACVGLVLVPGRAPAPPQLDGPEQPKTPT